MHPEWFHFKLSNAYKFVLLRYRNKNLDFSKYQWDNIFIGIFYSIFSNDLILFLYTVFWTASYGEMKTVIFLNLFIFLGYIMILQISAFFSSLQLKTSTFFNYIHHLSNSSHNFFCRQLLETIWQWYFISRSLCWNILLWMPKGPLL